MHECFGSVVAEVAEASAEEEDNGNCISIKPPIIVSELAARHDRLASVRGSGLYLAVDVVEPTTGEPDSPAAVALVSELRARRKAAPAGPPMREGWGVAPR